MKQDLQKLFSTAIVTYMFVLCITLIVKIIGLDYFGLEISNPFILKLSNLITTNCIVNNIIYFIPLIINQFIIISVICNDNSRRMIKYNILSLPLFYILETTKLNLFGNLSTIIELLYFFIFIIIYNKNINKQIIKRFLKTILFMLFIQIFSVFTRVNYSIEYITNPITNLLLNFDYIIILIIMYKLNFMKGDEKTCSYQVVQYSFLHQQTSLKNSLKKLQIKSLTNKQKFIFFTTWTLYLLWNIFTVFIILFVAKINGTIVECIFILTAFWLNKRVFGKPFHMKNAYQCFIVSNLAYYCLNRLTLHLQISILIPVILGILLSYFTSKLVKKNEKKLYRGMSEDELKYYLTKITNNKLDYKICKLFYVDRCSEVKIASMVNYSVENIKKRKKIINDKLKELFI